MTALDKVLRRDQIRARRADLKRNLNRLVEARYLVPGLDPVLRMPVRGSRGESGSFNEIDPDA